MIMNTLDEQPAATFPDPATQEREVAMLEQAVMAHPELSMQVSGDIMAARNAIRAGQPIDPTVFSRIHTALSDHETKQMLNAVGGGLAGVAGAAALFEMPHGLANNPHSAQKATSAARGLMLLMAADDNNISIKDLPDSAHFTPSIEAPLSRSAPQPIIQPSRDAGRSISSN